MKIIFAGAEKGAFQDLLYEEKAKNILLSFYWNKEASLKETKERGFDIFLDSGGYSARKSGIEVNIKEYGEFLEKNKEYIFAGANLDVMDLEQSLKNEEYLKQFYPVLPVYHYSEYVKKELNVLEKFCEENKYIAIGGIAGMNPDKRIMMNFLNYCFKTIIKYPGLKVHGFGITSLELLKTYPFYSVDSTAWLSGGKFGTILKWNNNFKMKTNIHYSEKDRMIENNFSVNLIDDYKERLRNNIREILKMEKEVTRLWDIRGIKYKDN